MQKYVFSVPLSSFSPVILANITVGGICTASQFQVQLPLLYTAWTNISSEISPEVTAVTFHDFSVLAQKIMKGIHSCKPASQHCPMWPASSSVCRYRHGDECVGGGGGHPVRQSLWEDREEGGGGGDGGGWGGQLAGEDALVFLSGTTTKTWDSYSKSHLAQREDVLQVMLHVLRCPLTYEGQAESSALAWFSVALHPRKPEGSLGWTARDGHLDSHTASELWQGCTSGGVYVPCVYTHARWELPEVTQVFVVVLVLCILSVN